MMSTFTWATSSNNLALQACKFRPASLAAMTFPARCCISGSVSVRFTPALINAEWHISTGLRCRSLHRNIGEFLRDHDVDRWPCVVINQIYLFPSREHLHSCSTGIVNKVLETLQGGWSQSYCMMHQSDFIWYSESAVAVTPTLVMDNSPDRLTSRRSSITPPSP